MAGVERRLPAADLRLGKSTSKPASRRTARRRRPHPGTAGRRGTSRRAGRAPSARLYGPCLSLPLERAPGRLTGRDVYLKREDVHELGASRARCAARPRAAIVRDGATGVVTASTGNHGAATAWAAQLLGLAATVFVPEGRAGRSSPSSPRSGRSSSRRAPTSTRRRRGSRLRGAGGPSPSSRTAPSRRSSTATRPIGDEIVDQLGEEPAAVVVPVGNGALLAGVGRALGARRRETRRIGVVSAGAPVMASVVASAARSSATSATRSPTGSRCAAIPLPSTGCWRRPTPCSRSRSGDRGRRRRLRRRRHPGGGGRGSLGGAAQDRRRRPDRARRHRAQHRRRAARPLPHSLQDCPWTRPL